MYGVNWAGTGVIWATFYFASLSSLNNFNSMLKVLEVYSSSVAGYYTKHVQCLLWVPGTFNNTQYLYSHTDKDIEIDKLSCCRNHHLHLTFLFWNLNMCWVTAPLLKRVIMPSEFLRRGRIYYDYGQCKIKENLKWMLEFN